MPGNSKSPYGPVPDDEDDDDFDWKNSLDNPEDEDYIYVIYPDVKYDKKTKERIVEELHFKWVLTRWETKEPFTKKEIDDLLMDGIVIEKR